MTCTERCRKAAPGTCCCSCEGANHGEAAPIQQKRLGFESSTRWSQNPGEPATEAKMALALGGDRLEANYPLSPEARSAVERDLAERNGINLAALAVEVHPADCAGPCCTSVLAETSRELWADVARREDVAIMALGGGRVGAVFVPEKTPVPFGMTPSQAVEAGSLRVPHDRTIEGRTVHLSPGYRYTLDSDAGEPIWFAYFGATHTSAVDPDVAARKALGLHGPRA